MKNNTKVFAHRGGGLSAPENTLAAFSRAIKQNVSGIELDVQLSKDNIPVVIHDAAVERTTNGKGTVSELSLKDLKSLDAGSYFSKSFEYEMIPTLEEVLNLLNEKKYAGILNIELKTDENSYEGIENIVYGIIASHQWSFSIIFSSFNLETLERLHKITNQEIAYISDGNVQKISIAS